MNNNIYDFLAVLFILLSAYEVVNLVLESRSQKSFSLVFKAITSIKNYMKIKLLLRSEEFKLMAGIDTYGTLGHLLIILISVIFGSYFFSQVWFVIGAMILIGTSLSVVLWDMMFWTGTSIKLFFESLFRVAVNRVMIINATNSQVEKKRTRSLIDKVKNVNLGDLLPSFIARFVFVVMLVIIGFAFEYLQLSRLDSLSFLNRSGYPISSFLEFLYQSVMMTTAFGADMQPSQWGEFILACHALISLYLFVMVLAFFTTLSENKLEVEKSKFLSDFNIFLKPSKEVNK